jgi:hypothetical protein
MNLAYRATPDRRFGLLLTLFVHVALVVGWQALRSLPAPAPSSDDAGSRVLWIPLPLPRPLPRAAPADKMPARPPAASAASTASATPHPHARPAPVPATTPAREAVATEAPIAAPAPAQAPDAKPSAAQILERAKRDAGSIAKALRKENNPYIAAPPDSPQLRLQQGIEDAHAMAPNRLWEAPKVEELVNNTGDGARRSRVITGNGTYCVTERATNTDVEMIEHHGKLRLTNCPKHETPARQQTWRTLRD